MSSTIVKKFGQLRQWTGGLANMQHLVHIDVDKARNLGGRSARTLRKSSSGWTKRLLDASTQWPGSKALFKRLSNTSVRPLCQEPCERRL